VAILPAKITRDRNGQIIGLGIPGKNDEQTISCRQIRPCPEFLKRADGGEQPFGSSTVRNDCASLRVAPSRKSATSTFSSPDEILKQCWKPQKKAPRVRVVLQLLYVVR